MQNMVRKSFSRLINKHIKNKKPLMHWFFRKDFSLISTFILSPKSAGVPEWSKGQGLGVLKGFTF